MRLFRFQKSYEHYLDCLSRLKNSGRSAEDTWKYIENTFKQMTNPKEIKNFINAYHDALGIDYQFFHVITDANARESCDYPDLRYMGNIIHIAHVAKNEYALRYIFGSFSQPNLFEVVVKNACISAIDRDADTLPQRLLPEHCKVSYLMGFHQRLGANSTLLAAANNSLGQKGFEKEISKEIFSYLR
jgi:hypothetical protein